MKRRIAKKKHLGVYQETGFSAPFRTKPDTVWLGYDDLEGLFDRWLDFLDSIGLEVGGCSEHNFIACSKRYSRVTCEQMQELADWYAAQPEIAWFEIGEIKDAWHDDF